MHVYIYMFGLFGDGSDRDLFSYFVGTVPGISREHVAMIISVVTKYRDHSDSIACETAPPSFRFCSETSLLSLLLLSASPCVPRNIFSFSTVLARRRGSSTSLRSFVRPGCMLVIVFCGTCREAERGLRQVFEVPFELRCMLAVIFLWYLYRAL
jgi:hypothetical protein